MLFRCPNCKRRGFVSKFPRVRCSCGHLCQGECFDANTDPSVSKDQPVPELPCLHRGLPIKRIDCGCEGNRTLYQCETYGQCLIRPLPASTFRGMSCEACLDRTSPASAAAIITTHFNPAGRQRLRDTYAQWAKRLDHSNICYEAAFGDPEIPGSVAIAATDRNLLWQKERLINIALEQLPASVRWVCWIDHDLVFERADWLEAAVAMLQDGRDAVQLFDRIRYIDQAGKIISSTESAASVALRGQRAGTAPGGAWVASREWLSRIGGIYDRNIVGGGDAVFFSAVSKQPSKFLGRQPDAVRIDAQQWIDQVAEVRYGCLPGAVRHLWHGDRENRQYHSRDAMLCQFDFDPRAHLRIGSNGLLELTDSAPTGLSAAIAEYFAARRDDG